MDCLSHSPLSKSCHWHLGIALGAQLLLSFRWGGGTSSRPYALEPSVQGLLLGVHAFYNEVPPSFSFFYLKIYLFIFGCAGSLLLSLVAVSGCYSLLQCMGFSLQWLLLLQDMGSKCMGFVVVARGVSCSTACGIESVFPALAGRFLATDPPGKSLCFFYNGKFVSLATFIYINLDSWLCFIPWVII